MLPFVASDHGYSKAIINKLIIKLKPENIKQKDPQVNILNQSNLTKKIISTSENLR